MNGKSGSTMTAKPIRVQPFGSHSNAVVVEVCGRGYYIGKSEFTTEEKDPMKNGFLIS